jgi:putative Mg2+ transporter-C (MgtC) family protein
MDISVAQIIEHLILMGVAYLLAMPIAWDREKHDRSAGLRTFPLVAMASCGFMLVGLHTMADSGALARIMQGIIGGIGFIGGGAILKNKNTVTGTATAASLWGTGAIGVAVAWKNLEIAITISLITFTTFALLKKFVSEVEEKTKEAKKEKE